MYRIIDERGSGKTGRLFLLAKENNGIIACANPHAMRVKAERYGILGIDFISYSELLEQGPKITGNIFIDELEVFEQYAIRNMSGFMGYTLSKE